MIEVVAGVGPVVNGLSGVATVAFGIWVLTLTPRSRSTKLLASFAVAFGSLFALFTGNWLQGWPVAVIGVGESALAGVSAAALLLLARELLSSGRGRGDRLFHLAVAIAVGLGAWTAATIGFYPSSFGVEGVPLSVAIFDALRIVSLSVGIGAFIGLLLALAWLYRDPPEDGGATVRDQAVFISAALTLPPAFQTGFLLTPLRPGISIILLWGVGMATVNALWLANTLVDADRSHHARNLALLGPAVILAGLIYAVVLLPTFGWSSGGPLFGVMRFAVVLILGYAILRHQVLGIEAKFRWGVSKTTVAGVFIAVFFIVSEGAQQFFAATALGPWLGILAAGALLFALSPIQRLADRIAQAAVPGQGPTPRAEAAYKEMLRKFLSDGALSRDEEKALADLAGELGLDPGRAFELRDEVEDEVAAGGGAA